MTERRIIPQRILSSLNNLLGFGKHVLVQFFHNKGLLLAGAVGYNALLSMVPLFALLLVVLSSVFDEALLLETIKFELSTILPGYADTIAAALGAFLEEREIVGGVGFVVLLFFSSIAFRILEDAFSVIFREVKTKKKRPFLVSALIPYVYIGAVGLSLLAISIVTGVLDSISDKSYTVYGYNLNFAWATSYSLDFLGFLSVSLLLTSLYKVMPVATIHWRRALIGGLSASFLWEVVRRIVVWYFANLSLVNVLYGSLATVIIVLLMMEIASFIILLGAQVIAELEVNAIEGRPWYVERFTDPEYEPIHDSIPPPSEKKRKVSAQNSSAAATNEA